VEKALAVAVSECVTHLQLNSFVPLLLFVLLT